MPVSVQIESVTPILIVREIEPCLDFWQRLGFQKVAEVPHEGRLGFVMFTDGKHNLMLQSEASADADVKIAPRAGGGVVYLNVPSIDAVEQTMDQGLSHIAAAQYSNLLSFQRTFRHIFPSPSSLKSNS